MSIRVMNWVWEHSAAKGTERLLLLAIADAADDTGRNAFPSIDTLARKIVMSPRTVQRLIAKLEAAGLIEVSRHAGGRDSNRYRIVMPEPDIGAGSARNQADSQQPHESSAQSTGGDKMSPRQTVTPDTAMSPQGCHSYDTPAVTQLCRPTPPLTVLYPSTGAVPSHRSTGGGGGDDRPAHADDDTSGARRVLARLGSQWRLGARSIERLEPQVAAALDAGWGETELAEHLGANSVGVKSPYAVLAARLSDLPVPPAARPVRPAWCGDCHEATRLIDTDTGAKRCPTCHPAVAAGDPAAIRRSS